MLNAKSTSSTVIQKFDAKGFEAEMNYQPSKHLYATLSYSYIDATVTAPFQSDGGTPLLPTQGIDYANVHQVSGLPKNQFNGLLSYGLDNGLTFTLNGTYTTKINNNYAGTLVIPVLYELGRELYDRRTGLIAAAFAAVSPLLVWYAQEVRMYAFVTLFGLLALLTQLRVIRNPGMLNWAAYILATAALLWSHYFTSRRYRSARKALCPDCRR